MKSIASRSFESSAGDSVRDPSPRLMQRLATMQDSIRTWMPDVQPLSVAEVLRLAGGESAPSANLGEELLKVAQGALDEADVTANLRAP